MKKLEWATSCFYHATTTLTWPLLLMAMAIYVPVASCLTRLREGRVRCEFQRVARDPIHISYLRRHQMLAFCYNR